MQEKRCDKKTGIKAILLVMTFAALVYSQSLKNSFVFDDYYVILRNDFIKSWNNFPKIFSKAYLASEQDALFLGSRDITSGEASYRPVVTISYFLDYSLWKERPFGYHLTNLLLHLLNAALFYIFAGILTNSNGIALFASLFFALHPVNAEAVSVITFREDLLAFSFFLSSFILYIKSFAYGPAKKRLFYGCSLVLFLLSLFSKEMAVTLPLMLLVYDWYFVFGGRIKDTIRHFRSRYLGYALLLVFYLAVWGLVINKGLPAQYPGLSFCSNALTMLTVFAQYIKFMALPFGIHLVLTDPSMFSLSVSPEAVISLLLILLCLIYGIIIYKRSKIISFSIFWFFITLLPASNILPLRSIMAMRYLYIPIAGYCIIVSVVLFKAYGQKPKFLPQDVMRAFIACLVILVIFGYSALTVKNTLVWKNDQTFWSEMERAYPHRASPNYELGSYYYERGLFDEAISQYTTAIGKNHSFSDAYIGLGICLQKKGLFGEAFAAYKKALQINPRLANAYSNLGVLFLQQGQFRESILLFEQAIGIDQKFMPAYEGLGASYLYLKDIESAKNIWKRALAINPDYKKIKEKLKKLEQFRP